MNNNETTTKNEMAPPKSSIGVPGWLKQNLFSNWWNTLLTIIFTVITIYVVKGTFTWVFFTAEWSVVSENFKLLMVGQYPDEELWRVWTALSIFTALVGISWGVWKGTMGHVSIFLGVVMAITMVVPFIAVGSRIWLAANIGLLVLGFAIGKQSEKLKKPVLVGWFLLVPIGMFFIEGFGLLNEVSTNFWGGFLLTCLIAIISIIASFPIGILLALGRRSNLPIIKWFSIIYIELIRGIPLITVLFVAQLMLPLFLGDTIELDKVLRAMIGFTLFNAAYLAENVRGGLQSLPRGQYEAAQALGLNKAKMMTFVIMPQALKAVIPAMVGQFISIFKDTVLVSIVGLIDLLGMAKKIIANPQFLGTQMESFVFVAFVFFMICYLMSYVSRRLERSLGVGER
ncbi:amino acid ABC transporter permease [Pontibacillus marinus]|uniref:Polar amino acid ABC transporter permease n=1 Tax=Pontibacillus marinus BH030004 = DSM 16465 TaxID=1385511 RepID=A0A0A5I0T5_9BACI|nr:amino acid ABC transporter permease [Pontibacillus marinus]KGX89457.1 polar amino acid ABC transporter permease [Pontibacillus marinus BH030004 = DSM 16465]